MFSVDQAVYAGKVIDKWDQRYIVTLTNVMFQAKGSTINLGPIQVPLPPTNVQPEDYTRWFIEKTSVESWTADTVAALSLHSSVQRELRQSRYDL